MARTIQVQGTDEVMAVFGTPGTYYRGKWEDVQIVGVTQDEDVPLEVRTALVGLTIPTIFTKESIERQTGANFPIPENSRLAYCIDVAGVLKSAGKSREAEQLTRMAGNPLDMYTIEPTAYQLLNGNRSIIDFSMDDFRGGRHPFKKDGGFVHPYRKD